MCKQGTTYIGLLFHSVPSFQRSVYGIVDDALLGECKECTCRSERDFIRITLHLIRVCILASLSALDIPSQSVNLASQDSTNLILAIT